MFFQLYKWYQIPQRITYASSIAFTFQLLRKWVSAASKNVKLQTLYPMSTRVATHGGDYVIFTGTINP